MKEESLFHEALAFSSPDVRSAFLDRACAGDGKLRSAVEQLLAAHDQSGEFLSPIRTIAAESDGSSDFSVETANQAMSTDADSQQPSAGTLEAASPTVTIGQPAAESPPIPERIGRYQIREQIGRGGMGTVYIAHDPQLDRKIALKVPKLVGPEAEERFLREAQAAAAVSHPNLCPVYDAGRADGVAYLAMAYIPGSTLGNLLSQHGKLSPARATAIAAGVARGMAEAHRHGIVHRDLKPGNILFDRHGEPVVTDFGLARRANLQELSVDPSATTLNDPRLTQAGALLGTPAYMSPEQARGEVDKIGPVSDVYSLGAILFEMLTGRQPFRGETIAETIQKIENDPIPAMPGVPSGLAAICRRVLAKNPADRIPSMDAFNEELAAFAKRRRRTKRLAISAAACFLIVLASVVFYIRTNNGTIEVRLSDPSANVQVRVDGQEVVLTDNGRVTRLRPGDHDLVVKGDGFQTVAKQFKITRGDKVVLEVELKPDAVGGGPPPKPDPKKSGLTPEQAAKLAGFLARGKQLIRDTKFAELGPIADEAIQINPESPGALALRATYRASQNDIVRARADADKALKLNPETYQALVVRGFMHGGEEKYDEAIADFTVAIRLEPNEFVTWLNRSVCYFHKKEYWQAIHDATMAIDRGFPREDAYLQRAASYACLGDYQKALADYDTAAARAPQNAAVFVQRSAVHDKMKNKGKAAADWARAKELRPGLTDQDRALIPDPPKPAERKKLTPEQATERDRLLKRAQDAWDKNQFDGCKKAVEQAFAIDPTNPMVRTLRGMVLGRFGQIEAAIKELTEAIRLDPDFARAYAARGKIRDDQGKPAAGIADYTIALRIDAKDHQVWNIRGFAYSLRKQYHQALADFNESLKRKPDFALAKANRGMCYILLGEYEKAVADYEKVAGYQSWNPKWHMILSVLQAKLGRQKDADRERQAAIDKDASLKDAPLPDLPEPLPPIKKDPELAPDHPVKDLPKLARLLGAARRSSTLSNMPA